MSRTATVERNTLETRIRASLNLDGTGTSTLETGIPFLEHMLDQVARHGHQCVRIGNRHEPAGPHGIAPLDGITATLSQD